jgi:hypothetical protein
VPLVGNEYTLYRQSERDDLRLFGTFLLVFTAVAWYCARLMCVIVQLHAQ